MRLCCSGRFQLHHTGIKTLELNGGGVKGLQFQLHHAEIKN